MERIAARLAEGDTGERARTLEAPHRAAIKQERHRRVIKTQAPLVRRAVAGQARERDARAAAGALGILEELDVVRRGLNEQGARLTGKPELADDEEGALKLDGRLP